MKREQTWAWQHKHMMILTHVKSIKTTIFYCFSDISSNVNSYIKVSLLIGMSDWCLSYQSDHKDLHNLIQSIIHLVLLNDTNPQNEQINTSWTLSRTQLTVVCDASVFAQQAEIHLLLGDNALVLRPQTGRMTGEDKGVAVQASAISIY